MVTLTGELTEFLTALRDRNGGLASGLLAALELERAASLESIAKMPVDTCAVLISRHQGRIEMIDAMRAKLVEPQQKRGNQLKPTSR